MTEPTEHHQHADLPQGDAPRPDLPQPDVSEPSGIAALISHRISRRTLGKLAIGPAVAASMASLGLAGATPAVATPGQLTRAEFLAMISDYFDWVHSSEYIDPYKLPQPTFHDVQLGKTPYAKQVETALEEKVVGNDRAMFLPRQPITRQDAADMLVRAFHIPNSSTDALAGFRDSGSIDADVRASVNAIVAASYMGGTSPTRFSPRDHVTGDQARAC